MKRSSTLFLILLLAPIAAYAVNGASYSSGLSLLLPRGARPTAMGGAYGAVASGADSMGWNPAGLNQLRDWELNLGHMSYIQGITDDQIQIARPLYGLGALGVGFDYLNTGSQDFYDSFGNNTDASGASLGSFSPDEFSAQIALAVQLPHDVAVGLVYKVLRQNYSQSAMGSAFDLGLQWRDLLGKTLDLGFTAQNLGTPMALGSTYNNLPQDFRLGLAFHPGGGLLIALDDDFRPWSQPDSQFMWTYSYNRVHVGAEYAVPMGDWRTVGRVGYVMGPEQDQGDLAGLTVGLGLGAGRWQVDYAWAPMGDLGQTHRLNLTYTLGD